MAYFNLDELRDRYKDRLLGPEAPQVETDATDFTTIVDKYKDRILSPAETAAKEPGTKGAPDEGTPTLGAPALSLPKPAMPETASEPVMQQAEPMTVKPPVARQKPQKKELAKYDPRRLIPSRIRKKLADRSSRMEEEIKLFEDRVNKTGKGIVGGTIVPIAKGVGVAGIKTAGGLIEFLATSPGLVAQPVFKDAESKKEFYRKIEITKLARFGKWLSKYGDEAAELLEQMKPTKNLFEVQEGTWKPKVNTEYLTDPEYWTDTFLQTGSTVAGAIVAGGGTIAGCALVGALMEAAPMYSEMKEGGMSNTEASARAIAFGVIVNQLEKIGFGKMLKKAPKGALGRMLHIATTAGVEALTEYAEEPSGAFLKYMFADEDASAEEEFMRVLDAAIQGLNVLPGSFLTGGAMASVSPTARQQTEREAGGEAQVQGTESAKKRRSHDLFSGEERKGVLGPTEKGQLVTQEQKILFGKTKPRATKFTRVELGTRGGYVSSPTESEVKAVLIADAAAGHPVSAHAEALFGIISPEEIDTWVDSLPEGVRDGVIPMMVEREREKADPTASMLPFEEGSTVVYSTLAGERIVGKVTADGAISRDDGTTVTVPADEAGNVKLVETTPVQATQAPVDEAGAAVAPEPIPTPTSEEIGTPESIEGAVEGREVFPDPDPEGIGAKEDINRRMEKGLSREEAIEERDKEWNEADAWDKENAPAGTVAEDSNGKRFWKDEDGTWRRVDENGRVTEGQITSGVAPMRGGKIIARDVAFGDVGDVVGAEKVGIPPKRTMEESRQDPTAPAEGALDAPIDTDVDAKQATEVIEAQAGLREDGTIGVSNAEASRIREMAGLEEFTETESKALMTSMANAKAKGLDLRAESIAESIKKTPRTLNDEEKMGIALREAQLVNQHEQLMTEIDDLTKNDQYADAKVLSKELEGIEEKIELLTDATKFASREWGRSGRASQALIDLGTYDLAKTLVRAKANKGAKLTQKQRDAVAVAIKERDEVQAKLDKFQDQFDPKVLKAFIKESKSVVNEELALVRKRRRLAPNLAKREAKVKERLRKMGARVNDITGLPIEMTYLIGQLAQIKIEKGARKLQDVVDQIKADLPEISDKDVYESIAGRGKKTKKHLITETQKRSRDLKAQAGAMSDIMAILDGDEKAATQAKTQPSAELKSLSAIRTHLRKINRGLSQTAITASLHQRDEIRYQQIMTKIEAARQQLEEGYRVTKKQPRPDPGLIKVAKHTLREIKDLMKTEDALAKADGLIQKIKDGDFTDVDIPAPRAKRLISQELDNARVDLRMKKKAIKEYLESIKPMPWYKKAGGVALTLPRAMMASADVSTLLRQNIMFSYGHPIKAAKYNVKAIKPMFSDRTSEAIQMSMEADPAYKLAERSNMQFEDLDGPLSKQTEDLTSKVLDKIVILNKTVGPLIKGSARHMITFGNLVKLDYFKAALKANPNMNPEQQRDVAEKISLLTGRPARIGPKGSPISGQGLGVLGFAPKFAWSRLAAPGTVAAGIANPASRKFMVTEMARSATSFLVIMQLAMMMGYDIEDDPESSMFGRVKMGNTWIDMSGGIIPTFQKMIIAPILIGRHKWTKAPEGSARKKMSRELHSRYLRSQGTMDPWLQWLKYKNGPTVSIPMTMWSGENVIGQKQSVGETVLRSMVPLVIQEATQIAQDQLLNLPEKAAVIGLAAAGASPSTIQNEMMSPDISRILRKGDVGRVAPPTWKGANVPTWLHTDGRRQKEFDEQFYSRMAAIVRGMDIEDSTQKEIQEDIRDYAKVLRAEMKAEVSKLKKPKGDE